MVLVRLIDEPKARLLQGFLKVSSLKQSKATPKVEADIC